MAEFGWLANSLRLMTLDELRDCGVTIYQAPKVPKRARVVNLMNGVIVDFSVEREMPAVGCYAKLDDLRALGSRFAVDLVEVDRRLEPVTEDAAEPVEA
jgi:hypothetical protein